MPKGAQPLRTVTCRGCGRDFETSACGKASWYCRADDCPGAAGVTPEQRQRDAARRREAAERRALERERQQEAARERQRQRDEARAQRQREREAEAARRDIARLEPRAAQRAELAEQARRELDEARERLARAEGTPATIVEAIGAPLHEPSPAAGLPEPVATLPEVPQAVLEVLAVARRRAFRLSREGDSGKVGVRRAVTKVAHAEGVDGLHDALDELLAATLAWKMEAPPRRRVAAAEAA